MNTPEISQWAARAKEGDMDAFDCLVERFQRPVYHMAWGMLNDGHRAADATQEVFVKAFRSMGSFRGDASFGTWLFAIAANTCRTHRRVGNRRHARETLFGEWPCAETDPPEPEPDPAAAPDRQAQTQDLARLVRAAMADLPPDFGAVIVMRDLQDASYREIAEALGCSVGTVKSRLSRARGMVKDRLAPLWREGEEA